MFENRHRHGAGRASIAVVGALLLAMIAPASAASLAVLPVKQLTQPSGQLAAHPGPAAIPLRVQNPSAYRGAKAAAASAYQRRTRTARSITSSPRTVVSDGLSAPGLSAWGAGYYTPPDTTGAIGPNNYVELVNSEIAVYSRGSLSSPVAFDTESHFVGTSDPTCDGQIQWDQQGGRWLYSALDCNLSASPQQLFFGFSKSSDPSLAASNWCRYAINTAGTIEDYDKLGHDNTQIIIGANEFDSSENYLQSVVWVFDKPAPGDLTSQTCPDETTHELHQSLPGAFTPVPANLADASATGYVVADQPTAATQHQLTIYTIGRGGGDSGPSTVLDSTTVTVPGFDLPANVPQPSTSDELDSSDARLTQAVAVTDPITHAEGIWTQHTIAGAGGASVVRWYELTPGSTAPVQEGTVAGPSGTFAFNGAIAPTDDGSGAVIFYNSGDASHLVDLRAQSRVATTAPGQMSGDIQLGASTLTDVDGTCTGSFDEPCRWGDYAGATPDPLDPSLVWGTGELTTLPTDLRQLPQWSTINAAISVLPAPDLTTSAASGVDQSSATLNGTVNPQGYATGYHFQFGPSTSYGGATSPGDAGAGTSPQAVSTTVTGLAPSTTYHYRLVATNANGTTATADRTFTTAALPAPPANDTPPAAPLKVSILSGRIRVMNGMASVTLSCSRGRPAAVCRGALSITTRVKRRVRRRIHGRRRTVTIISTVLLAQGRYATASGVHVPTVLTLNPRGLALVVRASRRGITAQVSATLTGAGTTRRTITMTK